MYPALRIADPDRFGIAVTGVTGATHAAGDSAVPFSIMSVAKPFVFALACAALGPDEVRARIGVNATGLPFNALSAVERSPDGRTNPMVNPGAIATTRAASRTASPSPRRGSGSWPGLSAFAGRPLAVDEDLYLSAAATNHRNRSLAQFLYARGALATYPDEAVELYTRQSCVAVTAEDLAAMGATLADGGVQPAHRRARGRPGHLPGDARRRCSSPGCTRRPATGCTTSASPARAASAAAWSRCRRARARSARSRPRSTPRATACAAPARAAYLSRTLGLDILASAPSPDPHTA